MRKRLVPLFLAVALLLASAPPSLANPLDFDVPQGHFFKQANGQGGAGETGYVVLDDQDAQFWSEFRRLGGVGTLGYPVSHRFIWDGFLVQPFQKVVLQWRPEVKQAYFVNVFDRLVAAGKDPWLEYYRQTPPSFDTSADAGLGWDGVVRRHLALLDVNPAIKAAYAVDSDPIAHFGLPMSSKDYGNVFVVRAQRAVFQQWKVEVPWARAGQVVANGGDVTKEAGIYPDLATIPQPPPPATGVGTYVQTLLVGPGTPGRLYALQTSWIDATKIVRLLTSDDLGATWGEFAGGVPVDADCLSNVNLDYATPDALYASTCQGIYRWDGARWVPVSTLPTASVAIAYGEPSSMLAVAVAENQYLHLMRSDDGGHTWSDGGQGKESYTGIYELDVAIDPRNSSGAYVLSGYKNYLFSLYRGFARPGQWTPLPSPFPELGAPFMQGMTVDGASGALYVVARNSAGPFPSWVWLLWSPHQLWRTTNPGAPNVKDVHWELVHDFGDNVAARLLASGTGPRGTMLFANLDLAPEQQKFAPVLYRSLDGGQTWEPIAVPSA